MPRPVRVRPVAWGFLGCLPPLGVVYPAACPVLLSAGLAPCLSWNRLGVAATAQSEFLGLLASFRLRLSVRFLAFGALPRRRSYSPRFEEASVPSADIVRGPLSFLTRGVLWALPGFGSAPGLAFPAFVKRGRSPGFSSVGVDGVLAAGSYLPLNLGGSGIRSRKVAPITRFCGNDGECPNPILAIQTHVENSAPGGAPPGNGRDRIIRGCRVPRPMAD